MSKSRTLVLLAGILYAGFLLAACEHGPHHTHIDLAAAPPTVVNGFNAEFPGLTIAHVDRVDLPDHTFQYEVQFRDAKNTKQRRMFTADGRLVGDKANVALPR